MRKVCNYLVVMLATLTIGLTSCTDPKPAGPVGPAGDVEKAYVGAELVVTNDGVIIENGSMNIKAIDANNVEITLSNIVNGLPTVVIPGTIFQVDTKYNFETKVSIDSMGMVLGVKGAIFNEKAEINVAVEILSTEILGTWGFGVVTDDSPDIENRSPFIFNIVTKSGSLAYYAGEEPSDMSAAEFSSSVEGLVSGVLPGLVENFALTFHKNGYVGVKGAFMEELFDMPKLTRYFYNPTTKVLVFDAPIDALLGLAGANMDLTQQSGVQVKFNCTFKDGKLEAIVDQSLMAVLLPLIPTGEKLDTMLNSLDSIIPVELESLLPWIKGLVKTIAVALTDETNFESFVLGGRLSPIAITE